MIGWFLYLSFNTMKFTLIVCVSVYEICRFVYAVICLHCLNHRFYEFSFVVFAVIALCFCKRAILMKTASVVDRWIENFEVVLRTLWSFWFSVVFFVSLSRNVLKLSFESWMLVLTTMICLYRIKERSQSSNFFPILWRNLQIICIVK